MPVSPSELHIGSKAHSFSLKGVDDKVYSLSDFNGKDVLCIIFTCNHCPYAVAVEDRINDIAKKYSGKPFALVAINSNDEKAYPDDSFDNMKIRAGEKGFTFPYLRDDSQKTAKEYDAVCTPDIYLFDKDRVLKYRGRIDDSWKDESAVKNKDLERAIDLLLAGKDINFEMIPSMGCSIKWAAQS